MIFLAHKLKRVVRVLLGFVIYGQNQAKRAIRKLVRGQHQLTSTTFPDRYPQLFSEVRATSPHPDDDLSILSFGCSTGEECFSLEKYFAKARIIGADINMLNLWKARRKNVNKKIKFIYSTPESISHHGKYDVIFALSVLCRWEDTKDLEDCGAIYPFDKFCQTVKMLAAQIKPGGLLVIYNSNFRFEDSAEFKNFEIVYTPSVDNSGPVHKFDAHNRRLREMHVHCLYRKKQDNSA